MRKKFIVIFSSPFFLTLIISVVIFLLIPRYNHKYDIEVSKECVLPIDALVYYLDLNGDGRNEKVEIKDYQTVPVVEIFNTDGTFNNAWTQSGKRACKFQFIYGDYDQNGFLELYVFTEENDSIYINWVEPFKDDHLMPNKLPVCELTKVTEGCDYVQLKGDLSDLNADGKKELIFAINNGFGLMPRTLFAVDIYNKEILESPKSFISIKGPIYVVDLDDDGKDEVFYQTGATGNTSIDSILPYSDHSAWLTIHDNNLNFKFPPIEFKGDQKALFTVPVKFDEHFQLVSLLFDPRSASDPQRMFVYSVTGQQLAEVDLEGIAFLDQQLTLMPINSDKEIFLYVINPRTGDIYSLNKEYSLEHIQTIGEQAENFFVDDFDNDGEQDIMFYKVYSKTVCLSDREFNILAEAPLEIDHSYSEAHVGIKNHTNENPLIYAQFGLDVFNMELIAIPLYYNVMLFVGIYCGVFLVVFISQKMQSINLKQKKKVEDRINELQLKSTLSQLDPHFAFNVINTISSSILKDDKERANDYLVEFSRLLRRSLENSDKISWTLDQEIAFVSAYLKLQQSRFGDIFYSDIEIDNKVDQSIDIPKMIIQGYVENAIKHGLRPKGVGGLLEIKIYHKSKALFIEVKDNGIGRVASGESGITAGTGKGMKLNAELAELYNKLTNSDIQLNIEDLITSDNQPLGTKVSIIVPFKS